MGMAALPMLRSVTTSGELATPTGCWVEKFKLKGNATPVAVVAVPMRNAKEARWVVAVSVIGKSLEPVWPRTKASPVAFATMAGE